MMATFSVFTRKFCLSATSKVSRYWKVVQPTCARIDTQGAPSTDRYLSIEGRPVEIDGATAAQFDAAGNLYYCQRVS
jgi:hypothetical protein